jgi:hypothetical protein
LPGHPKGGYQADVLHFAQSLLYAVGVKDCLSKPYRSTDLLRSLEIVAEIVASGAGSPPFPKGFQVLHPAATVPPAVAA